MKDENGTVSRMSSSTHRTTPLDFYPFAYSLYNENLGAFCWYCLDEKKPHKRCVGCGTAVFCDKDCQKLAWKDHKFECKALKIKKSPVPSIEVRLLGRIVLRYKAILCGKDKEDPDFYKDRVSRRSIMDIWAHTKSISEDTFAMKKFNTIYEALSNFYNAKALLPYDVIFQLHCRDFINRHAISDAAYAKEIGKGLYLDLCAYDHSCRPNAIYVCDGFKATLRALNSTVNLLDRSTTFYSYIDLLYAKQERRKLLKDTWYFHCECERCADNQEHALTSINCSHCTCKPPQRLCVFGEQSYKDSNSQLITCPRCGVMLAREAVMEAIGSMRFVDELLEKTDLQAMGRTAAVDLLENMLDRTSSLLPQVNIYYCKIVQALIPFVDPYDSAKLLGLHLAAEECVRICYPHNHPALGFHLRNVGIFALRLGDLATAIAYLSEALAIFEFVMGPTHCLTKSTKNFFEEAKSSGSEKKNETNAKKPSDGELAQQEVTEAEGKAPKKVMLRCEVFAESFDRSTNDANTSRGLESTNSAEGTAEPSKNESLKIEAQLAANAEDVSKRENEIEKRRKSSARNGEDALNAAEENISENVVLIRDEMKAFADALNIEKDENFWKRKKRKEFEYAGSLMRRRKPKLSHHERPESRLHQHQHHRQHRHHSEMRDEQTRKKTSVLQKRDDQYDYENLRNQNQPTGNKNQPADNNDDELFARKIPIISKRADDLQLAEKLFVDTNQLSASAYVEKDASRTGVKKKAALKKVSPRARTPLPPFQNSTSAFTSSEPNASDPTDSQSQVLGPSFLTGLGLSDNLLGQTPANTEALAKPEEAKNYFTPPILLSVPNLESIASTTISEGSSLSAEKVEQSSQNVLNLKDAEEDEEYLRKPAAQRKSLTPERSLPEPNQLFEDHCSKDSSDTTPQKICVVPKIHSKNEKDGNSKLNDSNCCEEKFSEQQKEQLEQAEKEQQIKTQREQQQQKQLSQQEIKEKNFVPQESLGRKTQHDARTTNLASEAARQRKTQKKNK